MEIAEIAEIVSNFLENWGALVVSIVSLGLSGIAWKKSSKAQDLQDQLNELDLKIKQYELDSIERMQTQKDQACVEARVINITSGRSRLKVWNSGNATAYQITARFEEGSELMIFDKEKLPFDELETGKSFELPLIIHMGSANKFKIITEWESADGEKQTKVQMGDR